MNPSALLDLLRERGFQLELRGDALHYRAPKGALDDELRRHLCDLRAEVVRALRTAPAPLPVLGPDEVAAFKALKVAVRMRAPWCSDFWLVPERTGQDRLELTVDEAVTLVRLLDAFPGSRIESFRRPLPLALPADPRGWPDEWKDAWEERSAIMEHDGGLARPDAESEAEVRVRAEYARRVEDEGGGGEVTP